MISSPDFRKPPVLVRGLAKRFPGPDGKLFAALEDVNFEMKTGALASLTGPDGAGKTTLLRLICGILSPDDGEVEVFGMRPDTENPEFVSLLGFMPQRFGLYEDLSVYENAEIFGALAGIAGRALESRFSELLTLTGLAGFEKRPAGKLSGGMKQKLGLACALLAEPKLLILDEPTVGVDPLSRRELARIVAEMRRRTGMSALISTAYLEEAEAADDVVLLTDGRVIAQDAPKAIRARAAGRTFRATAINPDDATRTARTLMRRVAAVDPASPVLDAVPRGDAIEVLFVRAPVSTDAAREALEALLAAPSMNERIEPPASQGDRAPTLAVAKRVPRLEDAYATLTFASGQNLTSTERATAAHAEAALLHSGGNEDPVIRADHIAKRFGGFTAVSDTSFTVTKGEIFGLLGPNGAGKTTTFRMLCGLLPPTEGDIAVAGADLRHAKSEARARVGYVAQKFSLYERLTTRQNLVYFGECYGVYGRRLDEAVDRLAREGSLMKHLSRRTAELPLGAKRELAMACALVHSPSILFLDEATSGADVAARRAFWRRIVSLAEAGTTVVVTTHFMEEAEYCDRFLIQDAGKVLVLGAPREVRRAVGADSIEEAFVRIVERNRANRRSPKEAEA